MKKPYDITKYGILLVFTLALAISASSKTTDTYNYDGTNDAFTWNKPDKGVVKGTVSVILEGSGGGGSSANTGGNGGKATGNITVSNRTILNIYAAEGGGPNDDGSGGYGLFTGNSGTSDGGGGAGMAAITDSTGKEIIAAGGGSGGVTDSGFFDTSESSGAGANQTLGGSSSGTNADANGLPGEGFVSNEVIGGQTTTGGGANGGSSNTKGAAGDISITYDINNYSIINSKSTFNGTNYSKLQEKSQFVRSDRLTLRSNITDPDDNIKSVNISITDSEGVLRVDNASMTAIQSININGNPGSTFERNHSFAQDIPLGEWNFTVSVEDNKSLYRSSQGNFTVVDKTAPQWRNQFQNQTILTIHDSIVLGAEGYDNINLSHAVLATNETGKWENKTGVYNSPQKFQTRETWETSNFIWKNESITGNKSIHWRIWYNDTSGNYRSTDVKSFQVRENYNFTGLRDQTLTVSSSRPSRDSTLERVLDTMPSMGFQRRLSFDGNRQVSNNIFVTETINRSQVIKPLIEEPLTAVSIPNRSISGLRDVFTFVNATKVLGRSTNNLRNFITGASFQSTAARFAETGRLADAVVSVGNDVYSSFTGFRGISSNFNFQKQLNRVQKLSKNASTSFKLNLASSRQGSIQRLLQDSFNTQEGILRSFTGSRLFNNSLDFNEKTGYNGQTLTYSILSRTLSPQVSYIGTAERSIGNLRLITQNLDTSINTSKMAFLGREFAPTFSITDTQILENSLLRNFSSSLTYNSSNLPEFSGSRIISTAADFSFQTFTRSYISRTNSLTAAINFEAKQSSLINRLTNLNLELKTPNNRSIISSRSRMLNVIPEAIPSISFDGRRLLSENMDIVTTSYRDLSSGRNLLTGAFFTDNTTRFTQLGKIINSEIMTNSRETTFSQLARLTSQSLIAESKTNTDYSIYRIILTGTGVDISSNTSSQQLSRTISSIVNTSSLFNRNSVMQRQFALDLYNTFSTSNMYGDTRQVNLFLEAAEVQSRDTGSFRNILQEITSSSEEDRIGELERITSSILGAETSAQRTLIQARVIRQSLSYNTELIPALDTYRSVQQIISSSQETHVTSWIQRMISTEIKSQTNLDRSLVSQILQSENLTIEIAPGSDTKVNRIVDANIRTVLEEEPVYDLTRNIGETLFYSSNQTRGTILARLLATEASIQSSGSRLSALDRAVLLNTDLSSVTAGLTHTQRSVGTMINSLLQQNRIQTVNRAFDQRVNLGDALSADNSLQRFINTYLNLENSINRDTITGRATAEDISYNSSLDTQKTIYKAISQNIYVQEGPLRLIQSSRKIASDIALNQETDNVIDLFSAVVETGIGMQTQTGRTVSIVRKVAEDIMFDWFVDTLFSEYTEDTSDSGTSDSDSSNSGGGFGGVPNLNPQPEETSNLRFTNPEFTVKLAPGNSSQFEVELQNNGSKKALTRLELGKTDSDITNLITPEKKKYTIQAGESVKPTLNITAPYLPRDANLSSRIIQRTLYASANDSEATLPIDILVTAEQKQLLDISLNLEDKTVSDNENKQYSFEIFNLGKSGRVDIELYTTVTNSTGHIVHKEKEELAVQTSASLTRSLDLDMPPGEYNVKVEARYGGKDASSYSTLKVVKEDQNEISSRDLLKLGIVILAISAVILAVWWYRRQKVDYDALVQENIKDIKEYANNHDIQFEHLLEEEESHKDRKTLEKWAARKGNIDLQKFEEKLQGKPDLSEVSLKERQIEVIEKTYDDGYIKNSQYQEIAGVSNNTAYKDLEELIDKGIVEKKGEGRATHYEYLI